MINPSEFITEIPNLHPASNDFVSFWREMKRRCIEGYWVRGHFMPPNLFFYINLAQIQRNVGQSNLKTLGSPTLSDLEWQIFAYYTAAKGFSGFDLNEEESSNYALLDPTLTDEDLLYEHPSTLKLDGTRKKFVHPYNALLQSYPTDMGKPLYYNQMKNMVIAGSRDSGKALRNNSILYTPSGSKTIGEAVVGDRIYGADGKLTTITAVYPQGKVQLYRVYLRDGRTVDCCTNHLWTVYKKDRLVTINTLEMMNTLSSPRKVSYKNKKGIEYNLFIPKTEAVQYEEKSLPLDPYTLGVLLGDGSLTQSISYTSNDPEIAEYIPYTVKKLKGKYSYAINGLVPIIDKLNLRCKSEYKFIPEIYKQASVEQRLELLRGLLDTDGTCGKNSYIEFSSSSKQLAEDTLELARSLGIIGSIRERKTSRLLNYRVYLLTSEPVFKLKRKLERLVHKNTHTKVAVIGVEPIEEEEATCITIDNESRLFLTDNYVPTHNSYSVGLGFVLKEWLFDGALEYQDSSQLQRRSVDITVGAEESHRSGLMLSKVRVGLENLPGTRIIGGDLKPSPLTKQYEGSWTVGKQIIAKYEKRYASGWKDMGSGSVIKHRSFKDNSFADQGARNLMIVLEEAGMFSNLKEVFSNTKDNLRDGDRKTGMLIALGCVCKGTKVWTNDGRLVNVENLLQEDGVLGYAGNGVMTQPISWLKPPAKKPCYRIETEKGNIIECSEDHPLLWSNNNYRKNGVKTVTFKRADSIKVGDQLMSLRQVPSFGDKRMKNPRLIGLLIGDGNYTKGSSPSLSIEGEDIFNWLKENYNNFKISKEFLTKTKSTYRQVYFTNFIDELRELKMYGQSWENKKLPYNMHEVDLYSIKELLGGYFDADGSIYHNQKKNTTRITLTSKYKHLLEEVKALLYKLGIGCSIVQENRKRGFSPGIVHRLYITKYEDVLQFKKHIKFLSSTKQSILDNLKLKKSRYTYKKCNFILNPDNNKGTYYTNNDNILEGLESNRVKSISFIGEQEVYNLTAEITHTYITNSFISGNTGGDLGAGTQDLKDMFYNPDAYDILSLPDEWEHKGQIGFFIPAYMSLRRFKDEYGYTLKEKAINYWATQREKLKFGSSSDELAKEIQYRPNKPSEMFLASSSTIFPSLELQQRLSELMDSKEYSMNHKKVELFFDKNSIYNGVNYNINFNLTAITEFPWKGSKEGCVVIYEFPYLDDKTQTTPEGAYIIGCDPFRDNTNSGESFAAIYVIKTTKYPTTVGVNQIVASYISRPFMGTAEVNETLLKLSMFYGNAKIYFENAVGNVKDYFEKVKRLDLLALQPTTVFNKKAAVLSGQPLIYGYPMSSEKIKWEALQYVRNWALEARAVTEDKITRNLDLIPCPFLLQQLINFNMEGNFDAVMGFVGCIIGLEEIHNRQKTPQQLEEYSKLEQEFLNVVVNNKRLFK